jgi:hypothetical protein
MVNDPDRRGEMDIRSARHDLAKALIAAPDSGNTVRFRAAREILIEHGAAAVALSPAIGRSLEDIVALASRAPVTPPLRVFAVLLVTALATDGLLPSRGEAENRLRLLLERVLLNPLRRAGYPFDGTNYEKRQALTRLHKTIDEHLRPPEPSIPRWIHGIGPADED